jgi:AAA family ATP:ADP antiporter
MSSPARPVPASKPVGQRATELGLSLFGEVRAGEARSALLLTLNVFLLLTAYYLLKVAREPLILTTGGAEVKSYASAGQSVLLVFVTLAYSALGRRCGRMKLTAWVTGFFISNLLVFAALSRTSFPLGVPFYLWVGVFNVTVIAQFWAFAADIYTDERGRRIFPILGIGSSVGAVAGSTIAKALLPLGPCGLMVVAAVTLAACLGLTGWVDRRESEVDRKTRPPVEPVLGRTNGFALLLADRYLLLLAALALALNWVNTTGEYVLDRTLLSAANRQAAEQGLTTLEFVGQFKAEYFTWVNTLGVLLQCFVVSRVIKYVGLRRALFIMPFVSLAGYSTLALAPLLPLIFAAKVAENSLDYSLSNTARQALWLVTSREAKYKAKQAVDTFLVRAGDVLSAVSIWIGTQLGGGTRHFLALNIALVLVWMGILVVLVREHARRTATRA